MPPTTDVLMPKLGMAMSEGTMLEWKKTVGSRVTKGEILFTLESEKASHEHESPISGTLTEITAPEGTVVPVGGLVCRILGEAELPAPSRWPYWPSNEAGGAAAEAATAPAPATSPADEKDARTKSGILETTENHQPVEGPAIVRSSESIQQVLKISPLARKMATDHNIEIAALTGTGPEGRIVREDVLRAIEGRQNAGPAPEVVDADGTIVPLTAMRRTIAKRMAASFQTAPHFWIHDEADATDLLSARMRLAIQIEKENGARLTFTDILVKIAARALKMHPNVNVSWTDGGIRQITEVNVGIAVDLPDGLVVPVIRAADGKSLAAIAAERTALVGKARAGKITLDEMSGGTFTLNNVGPLGIRCLDAIINPPESAILSIGKIVERAVVVDGAIVVRPMIDLSLAVDHRPLDGGSAGRFLATIRRLIEDSAKNII